MEKEIDDDDCEQDLDRMDTDYDVPRPAKDEVPTEEYKKKFDRLSDEARRRYYEMGGV
jgi:hypothetical protein